MRMCIFFLLTLFVVSEFRRRLSSHQRGAAVVDRFRWWLGLGLLAVYFPLYAWRMAEDRRHGTAEYVTRAKESV